MPCRPSRLTSSPRDRIHSSVSWNSSVSRSPTSSGSPRGGADTIVERLAPAADPVDTIDIEQVALSLRSVDPIVVTENGGQNPGLWDVFVLTSPAAPSNGQMTIEHTGPGDGGIYSALIEVCPVFTFTEVGNPGNTRQFDLCLEGIPPQQIAVTDQPWQHNAVQPLQSPLSGPNFFVVGPTHHTGPHPTSDPVEQPEGDLCEQTFPPTCGGDCPPGLVCQEDPTGAPDCICGEPNGVPMSTAWGLVALFLLFLTVVMFVVARRRWQQA